MSRRVLTLIATLSLIFSIAGPAYASAQAAHSSSADGTTAASVSPKLQLEPAEATVVVDNPLKGATEGIFVIRLDASPLATYRGGVAGLAATSPEATGADKLDTTTAVSRAYVDYLETDQATFVARLEKAIGHSADVRYTYTNSTNGLAVWLTPTEAAKAARMPGVSSVRQEVIEQLETDAGPTYIGAPSIWGGPDCSGEGTCGEGVIVGILDTGINPGNPSFANPGPVDGYVHTNPYGTGVYVGACDGGGVTCNDKLIGAWDFTSTTAVDDDGHGSHTASTTAGNFVAASIDAPTMTIDADISGVAPHANIISYHVCVAGGGCPSAGTIAAIDQAIADGVDVINFSVGSGSPEDPWDSDSQQAWLAAREAGILVAHSTGNEGPGAATVGSPLAPWMMHVAATTHNRKFVNSVTGMTGGATTPPADIEGAGVTTGFGPAAIVFAGDYASAETETPELCGVGGEGDFDSPWASDQFDGEIVVCIRGTFGRVEKGANVLASGAGGYILVDNGAGLVGDAHELPGVHITQEDGADLLAWLADGGTGHMATISGALLDDSASNGDIMAGFSSRGPNRSVLDMIAPSVAAPGVDIIAADGVAVDDSWGFNSGTSMASPHAAGAAALLVALNPTWTPAEIQSALMTTGVTDVLKEDGTTPADWFDMGSGRIQLEAAASAGLVLDIDPADFTTADPATGGDPASLNLPSMASSQCVLGCSWTRTVTATTDGTWTATAAADDFGLTVEPASFSLLEGETQDVVVTADVTAADTGIWMFGEVVLSAAGVPDTLMPVAANASRGTLPASIDIVTRRDAGSEVVTDLTAIEISQLTVETFGLAVGTGVDLELASDSDNGSAFDDLSDGVFWTTVEVPAGVMRMVAETYDSESPDLDLMVGTGDTPSEATMVCISASGTADEFCDIADPDAGTYWILVQNWSGSGAPLDMAQLSYGLVSGDEGNLLIEGPAQQPQLDPFDIRVLFDEPDLEAGDRAYGAFSIGTGPGSAGNVGTIAVNLARVGDDVVKTVDAVVAEEGDTVTYTITIEPNPTDTDIAYSVVDFLPEGLTYVPGSASGGLTLRSDGALTWSGVMEKSLEPFYTMSTSDTDSSCVMPLAGADSDPTDSYLNLEDFGLLTEADLVGDTMVWELTAGTFNFYGTVYESFEFTDDGFAIFDSATNYAGEPWITQVIPNTAAPNNVAAMLWQDFEAFYDAGTNTGITTVNLTSDGIPTATIVEYDNVSPWNDSATVLLDFEVFMPFEVGSGPEIIFAYDNILVDVPGTIGVENSTGTSAESALNNDLISSIGLADGDAICFDLTASVSEAVVLTYQATVDTGAAGTIITNEASHTVDSIGSATEVASVDLPVGDVTPPTDGASLWATEVLSSSLTLMWDAGSDDRAVTGYGIYQDGVHLDDVTTGTMYDVTGLTPSTEYGFTVKAMDAVGNLSAGLMLDVTTAKDFTDDDFSIFEDDIEWLFSAGITKGCNPPTNDEYCPNDSLTRGQLAAMLNRGLKLPAASQDYFTDDDDSIFEDDINRLAEAGITFGCNAAGTEFCPTGIVTRGELAAMLDRGLNLPSSPTDYFTDDDGHLFEASINSLAEAGITKGCNPPANDNYCPDDLLTRGQIAAFLHRALG